VELLLNGFEDYGQHQAQTVLRDAGLPGFPNLVVEDDLLKL